MKQSVSLLEFYNEFFLQVMLSKDSETFGWSDEDFFASVILDYLEEAGEVEDPIICPYRDRGLQLNGYSISEDCSSVDIFVSIFINDEKLQSVAKNEVDAALKRAIQLYRKAINDLYASFEHDDDTYEFAFTLHKNKKSIKKVRITAITNGLVKSIPLNNIFIDDAEISFNVWDIDRLYRCFISGKMRETIEIDFFEKFNTTIDCLENVCSDKYNVYLAIINGEILARLYEEFGPRLLERNVRSFLQVKGAVNKGIRDTLKDSPDMFLAYNNGISVTAESIEIIRDENGRPKIRKIRDMQIVNGGQTTASIYNAKQEKKSSTDLSQVFVQMKISVINSAESMDDIVPKISEYANTQNKIQMADFSANDPFHRKIEELSRTIWAPAQGGSKPQNWFYERARGQYSDMLSHESTPLRKRQFKEQHPLFTKTDLAKFENTWDQLPHFVSEGAQKNFKRFTIRLKERGSVKIDALYFEHLISRAIMFRNAEKLVQHQNFGGYRANIVTYSLALLSYKSAQRIDLNRIWREQRISEALENEIISVSKKVHQIIVNPPGGANIGEWCKNSKCWNAVKEAAYDLSEDFEKELISVARPLNHHAEEHNSGINNLNDSERIEIEKVKSIDSAIWFSMARWAKETNNFQTWQRSLIFTVGTLIGRDKDPSYKQAHQALKVYEESIEKGFSA